MVTLLPWGPSRVPMGGILLPPGTASLYSDTASVAEYVKWTVPWVPAVGTNE
jgi:hypothetical protein